MNEQEKTLWTIQHRIERQFAKNDIGNTTRRELVDLINDICEELRETLKLY